MDPQVPPARPWARFDDLVTGRAVVCPPPHRVLVAVEPGEVADVLAEVDAATAAGCWAYGLVSYEAASGLDPGLAVCERGADDVPLVWFGLCGEPASADVIGPDAVVPGSETGPGGQVEWRPDWSDAEHAAAVGVVRERIAAGDTYQCNLTDRLRTDRLRTEGTDAPESLYARLALAQRGAYNAYLDTGRHVIASASPELFFERVGDRVRTRPMKGTTARGRTTAEDEEASRRLRASPKEQAENLMIVDLLRNDLAKVAEVGGVEVTELFALERYPTVWQLASEVTAQVRPGTSLVDLFRALFPCGSVTGAPKRSTMVLIRELEPTPRGVYCGAVGLVAPRTAPVRARFSVAIRTAVLDRCSGTAVYGVGGGITWGSVAAAEREELHAKAAVLTHDTGDHQLLETLAHLPPAGLRHARRHLARMADSATYFGFAFDADAVSSALAAAVAGVDEPARVRLLLDRDGRPTVELRDLPAPATGPVELVVDAEPVDAGSAWLQHKTTRREVYACRARRHPRAGDVVLVNERGEVTESTVANLAVRLDGVWWTPPTACGCLPGVERGRLLERGDLHERVLRVSDLRAAQGLALVSSLRGWRAAVLAAPREPGA